MLRPGIRRVMGSIVIAEITWWGVPALAGAAGLTLSIARQRMDVDWLVFVGTAVGAVAAPAAGWATASSGHCACGADASWPHLNLATARTRRDRVSYFLTSAVQRADSITLRTSPRCESICLRASGRRRR